MELKYQIEFAIHDFRFPGYRYENSLSDSDHFLVLIFDANGILCGAQVALPKALANPRFKYENNPYYVEGTYDGNNGFSKLAVLQGAASLMVIAKSL